MGEFRYSESDGIIVRYTISGGEEPLFARRFSKRSETVFGNVSYRGPFIFAFYAYLSKVSSCSNV